MKQLVLLTHHHTMICIKTIEMLNNYEKDSFNTLLFYYIC